MKICVHGAAHATNFGDLLLHQILINWIREINPKIHVNLPYSPLSNLYDIGADSVGLDEARDAKALIFSGGGYFGEPTEDIDSWSQRNYERYVQVGLKAIEQGLPVAIIGVGAGPLTDSRIRSGIVRLFNSSAVAAVRDQESYDYLVEYGVTPERLCVTADAALTLSSRLKDPSFLQKSLNLKERLARPEKKLLGQHIQGSWKCPYNRNVDSQIYKWKSKTDQWLLYRLIDRRLSRRDLMVEYLKDRKSTRLNSSH